MLNKIFIPVTNDIVKCYDDSTKVIDKSLYALINVILNLNFKPIINVQVIYSLFYLLYSQIISFRKRS